MTTEKENATATPFRELRIKTGLTMRDAAEYSDTPYRTWQDWERGARRVPGIAWAWLETFAKRVSE